MSDDILRKLASEIEELDALMKQANEDVQDTVDGSSKTAADVQWFVDSLKASGTPHDLGWLEDHLSKTEGDLDEQELKRAEHLKEELLRMVQDFPRKELVMLAADFDDMFHTINNTLKMIDADIKRHDIKDMAKKLTELESDLRATIQHAESSLKHFDYVHDLGQLIKTFGLS